MRLRNLVLSNVGPYVGRVELDFTELGDVFLVCGKTGSGKTTIFDAVAYALYGSAVSGRDIVSHFAADGDEVFVDLDFEAGRQRWRVQRKPARTVAKKRGAGTTDRPMEVALWRREASSWIPAGGKATEVDAALERIIGLSSKEFIKIVLLPQGEFQRFLEMNTGERTPILEKLFPVDLHAAVSDLAREKAKEAEARARDLDDRIRVSQEALGAEPEAALVAAGRELDSARAAEKAAGGALDAAKASGQAAAIGARAWAELEAARGEREALEAGASQAASLSARLSRAEAAVGASAALEAAGRARQERSAAELSVSAASAAMADSDSKAPGAASTRERLGELATGLAAMDREAGLLAARSMAWARLLGASDRLESARTRLGTAQAARDAASLSLAKEVVALEALEAGVADSKALSAERDAAAAGAEAGREAVRLSLESERFSAELEGLRSRLAVETASRGDAAARLAEATVALASAEAAVESRRDAIAAERLASRLADGQPCPVCGSPDHPAPAGAEAGVAMRAGQHDGGKLEDTERALSGARNAARSMENDAVAAGTRAAQLEKTLSQREAEAASLLPVLSVAESLANLRAASGRLEAADRALALEADRSVEAARARAAIGRLRGGFDAAVAELSAAAAMVSAAESAAAEAASGAGGSDPGPLVDALGMKRASVSAEQARLESELAAWERERGNAVARAAEASARRQRALDALVLAEADAAMALAESGFDSEEAWAASVMGGSELAASKAEVMARANAESSSAARLAAAERAVAGVSRPDLAAIESALGLAEAAYVAARERLDAAARAERDTSAGLEALAGLVAERAALRERGDRLVAMARLLNGDTEGRRLSFKNYALGSYFAMVVDRASVRLREMSDARYDMRVAEGKAGGRGRVGLDLEVLDSFTGVARPASSLSGGEKFLASISLALGLSDVIVSRAGGVALDSIFIDEGFGSLDDETMDRAIAALDRVRGERVIGIVSHVAELRSRIPSRIEVEKARRGSTLRVVS